MIEQITLDEVLKLVTFENAGHWLHHDQFDRFVAELRAFL